MNEKTAERLGKEKTVMIEKDRLFLNAHGRNCIVKHSNTITHVQLNAHVPGKQFSYS